MKSTLRSSITVLGILGAAYAARANNFEFHVNLDTSALTSAPNSPFYLDFQLNEGSLTLPNQVTLSDFTFTNGSATGSGTDLGSVTGDLLSSITLASSSSSPFNEFFQSFAPSTTGIGFDVTVSQNTEGSTPDFFVASILDSESGLPQIATNAPDGVSLIDLGIAPANTIADIDVYSSTNPAGVSAAVSAVPEPSTTAAMFGVFAAGAIAVRRLRRKK